MTQTKLTQAYVYALTGVLHDNPSFLIIFWLEL